MKERPILFSGPMVRALLDGSKTQTRRVVKTSHATPTKFLGQDDTGALLFDANYRCPYGQPGDRLWVRESLAPTRDEHGYIVDWHYAADGAKVPRMPGLNPDFNDAMAFAHLARPTAVPSIHMPRWASRITLEVTGVRAERLNSVSEADAAAEGVEFVDAGRTYWKDYLGSSANCDEMTFLSARQSFSTLWNSINGDGAWAANPWVWVVEFKRINGDQQ